MGAKGVIRTHTRTGTLDLLGVKSEGWVERDLPPRDAPTVLDHLVGCLGQGKDPISSLDSNRASLAVCLAFYEAARQHEVVQL